MPYNEKSIKPLTARDYEQAIQFLNRTFNYQRENGFEYFLSGLYKPTDELMNCIYAIWEGDKLIATLGIYPIDWCLYDQKLRIGGVGGIAVDPDWQGKGLMGLMLRFAIKQMKRDGYQLSYLAGLRDRYRRYGWEVCGCQNVARFTPSCFKRIRAADSQADSLKFRSINQNSETIARLYEIYCQQKIRCERPADRFEDFLRHGALEPYVAFDSSDQPIGYATIDSNRTSIKELVLVDNKQQLAALSSFQNEIQFDDLVLYFRPWDMEYLRQLGTCAESITLQSSGNWQIFDWLATLSTLLNARCRISHMIDGKVNIEISDIGRRYSLSVAHNHASVSLTEEEPQLTATSEQWMRILFGPTQPSGVISIPYNARILDAWCPLPLSLMPIDHV
ncbi:GNAT family N-acetyltransferase [Poriferisphaera sp. WC338]|uniref:GNAT family N-acetyltransferase n=1 Tax=Poriferisphaera sp. WC338 TaxID=3425129 RepID=UPI003D819103